MIAQRLDRLDAQLRFALLTDDLDQLIRAAASPKRPDDVGFSLRCGCRGVKLYQFVESPDASQVADSIAAELGRGLRGCSRQQTLLVLVARIDIEDRPFERHIVR